MNNFDRAFVDLLGNEGAYSNNPKDPGGETMWGITLVTARACGYLGPMISMDQDTAKRIYRRNYWLPEFDKLPYPIAFNVFDGAVNSGVGQSVRWLQRALDVADDGRIGPVTMEAVLRADPYKVVVAYNSHRLEFLSKLSTWSTFGKGWSRRIANNLKLSATL